MRVDKGYLDAELLVASLTDHGIRLVGPVRQNSSWQARAGRGFDTSQFQVDWLTQTVTCPQGQRSVYWKLASKPSPLEKIHVQFDRRDCAACPVREYCTKSPKVPRKLVLQPQVKQEALRLARDFISRIVDWLDGKPQASTRPARFTRLAA